MFPAQLAVTTRRKEQGGEEHDRRTAGALVGSRFWFQGWLTITEGQGAEDLGTLYRTPLDGSVAPNTGHGHVLLSQ